MNHQSFNHLTVLFVIILKGLCAIVPYSRPYLYQHLPYRRMYSQNDPSVWMSKLPVHNSRISNQAMDSVSFTQQNPRIVNNNVHPPLMRADDPETYYADWLQLLSGQKRQRCFPIPSNMSLCHQVGYSQMVLPNYLHHEDLKEAIDQSQIWMSLVHTECHPDLRKFLCALYAPVCVDGGQSDLILPCSDMCNEVRQKCLPKMLQFGFDWPDIVTCSRFPLSSSKMCIPSTTNARPQCSGCLENPTYESVMSSFCMADISLRVRINHAVVTNGSRGYSYHMRIDPKFKHYKLNIPINTVSGLYFEVQCGCDILHRSLPGKRYRLGKWIVMGKLSNDGRTVQVEHISRLKREARDLRSAVKVMRKSPLGICQLPFRNKTDRSRVGEIEKSGYIEDSGKHRDTIDFQSDSVVQIGRPAYLVSGRADNSQWNNPQLNQPLITMFPKRRASLRSSSRKSLVRRSQNFPFQHTTHEMPETFGRNTYQPSSWSSHRIISSPSSKNIILPRDADSIRKDIQILEADQELFAPHTLQPWF